MTKEPQTPEIIARRHKAFELYLTKDDQGKRQSLNNIALAVGATLSAVKYWKKKDDWDLKVADNAAARQRAADHSSNAVRAMLRAGVFEHIGTLNQIIRDKTRNKAGERIKAIVEFCKLAKELDALEPAMPEPETKPEAFKDDIPLPQSEESHESEPADHAGLEGESGESSVDGGGGGDGERGEILLVG